MLVGLSVTPNLGKQWFLNGGEGPFPVLSSEANSPLQM